MNKVLLKYFCYVLICLLIFSCQKKNKLSETSFHLDIPAGFPEMEIPDHNSLTVEKIALGKKLFFDPVLSSDSTMSCSSCHLPELAFADHIPVSTGVKGMKGTRNSPTLTNIGYAPYLFMEGEVNDLETQALAPIQHIEEMGLPLKEAVQRLRTDQKYEKLFTNAFGEEASPGTIVRALACFERTIISGNSRYDQFNNGDSSALNEEEKKGMKLFFSDKTNCVQCHGGFNFTNYAFENIGLYSNYEDMGKMRATSKPEDDGKFKVPTLRNIGLTFPYMHDGSINTLEEVVEFYNQGEKKHTSQSKWIRPLNLTEKEKKEMVSFLHALTDKEFISKKWN